MSSVQAIQAVESKIARDPHFVSIEDCETRRQTESAASFKARRGEAYARAVSASAQLKKALQAWEATKAELAELADGVHVSDLLIAVEREAASKLIEMTTAQAEQSARKQSKSAA